MIKFQCSKCDCETSRNKVSVKEIDRCLVYECKKCDKPEIKDLLNWIVRYPGAEKKIDKYLKNNPMPK